MTVTHNKLIKAFFQKKVTILNYLRYFNKISFTSSVLNIPIATPPSPEKLCTRYLTGSLPSEGVYIISTLPGPGTTKSVALYNQLNAKYKKKNTVTPYD